MKWISLFNYSRTKIVFILMIAAFIAIVLRIFYLQFFQYEYLSKKAEQNWDREIPFMSMRGEIVDRNGKTIVTNELAPTIYFMPAQNKDIDFVAQKLSNYLSVSEDKLKKQLSKKTYLIRLYPEGKNITPELAMQIADEKIRGIYVTMDYKRAYPYGTLLARLIGFTGADYTGLAGIEFAYNNVLKSLPHALRLYTDARGTPMPQVESSWRQGKDGATVQLTIDLELQQIVERELKQAMIKHDADQAWAIALNPQTGEILSLASLPSFDPADYRNVSPEIYNRNLPAFMTYEPGSTFKIITLAAALEEKVVDLQDEHFHDVGYTIIEGTRLRCWKREGHKDQTFLQVIENSCNPGFIELGRRVGKDKLYDYIRAFGFGESTNSSIAGEAKGIIFSREAFGPLEHATTSFGQGVSVTAIQQVQAVAAAINGGKLIQPSIVHSVIDASTNTTLYKNEPKFIRQVISEETSKEIRYSLESVVANGSGRNAFRDGLRIAGKTGTAQKVENGRYVEGNYIVSFIGFAPATDPKILVYVAIDHPKSHLQFGGVIAAPIVGTIIEESAHLFNIEKDDGQLPKKYVWGDELEERLPNFIGLSKKEVLSTYYPFTIQWYGEGETIVDQLPKPNQLLKNDEILHLFLSH